MNVNNFTDLEDEILTDLVKIHTKISELPDQHPDDSRDFRDSIHKLQRMIMQRPIRRDNERFICNE